MKRKYSKKTEILLQRMNKIALRQEFVCDKRKITKLLKEVYILFDLPIPEIVWCKDVTDKRFAGAAWAAGAARAARAAWAAGAARAAWAAGAAREAWAARAAWEAREAWAARAAWEAGAAGAARAARAAGAAGIDYDQGEFVIEYEFLQENEGNENDKKFFQAGELFLQLKEAGLGYLTEENGKLYCCPNPVIRLENLRYHSETKPAIEWKGGLRLFFLHGVYFKKEGWEKVVAKLLTFKEILALPNMEQRMIALKYYDIEKLLIDTQAELVDKTLKYELYEFDKLFPQKQYALKYKDPSTDRIYISFVDPQVGAKKSAIKALEWKFYLKKGEKFDYES